jgi:hypothetical protein
VPVVPVFPSLLQSAEDERRRTASQTDLNEKQIGQKVIREASPGYLEKDGK